MIRVGRRIYNKDGSYTDPHFDGYKKILCLTQSSAYGEISPYLLKDDKNRIMENLWQFSKVYEKVPATKAFYSRYNNKIIWQYPEEIHVVNNNLTDEYFNWREKGMNNEYAIRYPVGYRNKHNVLYSLAENNDGTLSEPLDYIESRKRIYVPVYCKLVKTQEKFKKLKKKLSKNENLLIIEVDGPHEDDIEYYMKKYNVDRSFITNNTIEANEENIRIMLNDSKYPFGHGYCLAIALLDKENEWIDTK